ncbi:MAG: serine protease [Spirochaetaceae bacterium]|nr:MAG: serine protease [Spirochaetaceae bacterium]
MADIMKDLSLGMGKAVKRAAKYTVGVEGRGGYPSSGVIYESGLVLSADHTVEREEEIEILMADGSRQSAKVKGRDPISDLVLLELSEKAGTPAAASEQKAEVGQIALALGRPTEEGIQASLGILSIVNGTYRAGRGIALEGVMRSDALRLPGFAGGPLVDNEGRLLGVNTVGSSSGTSITIPADMAWKIAAKLRSGESIKPGFLGIRSQQVELPEPSTLKRDQATGLLVVGVDAESPIAAAGVMVGDILVGFDGRPITDHEDLLEQLMTGMGGKTVSLELLRGGKREEVSVTVGTLDRPLRDRIHRRGWQRGCCP